MRFEVCAVVTGSWQENCYVVSDAAGNAVIIDPGDDAGAITSLIQENRLRPFAILATHAHHDHVGAAALLKHRYDIPFYLHSADQKLLKRMNFYRRLFGRRTILWRLARNERQNSHQHANNEQNHNATGHVLFPLQSSATCKEVKTAGLPC